MPNAYISIFISYIRLPDLQVEVSQAAVNGRSFMKEITHFTACKGFLVVFECSFMVSSFEA